MKQKKNFFGKQILSLFLAAILLLSGITVPVRADNSQGENAAAEEKPYVYFQYDDGRIQEMGEDQTFTLNLFDKGKFVLAGTDKRPDWNFSAKVYVTDTQYTTHYWINASGDYVPLDVRKIEGYVCNADNPSEIIQRFSIDNVSAEIEEVKAFVGEQEVSLDKPYQVEGNGGGNVIVKGRIKGTEEFKTIPTSVLHYETVSGPGMIYGPGSFMMMGDGEAVFKATLYENKNLAAEFKVTSGNVKLQDFTVTVPKVWYIDSWNALGGYYVGITFGHNPNNNFNYSFVPENATNQELVWEALTPDVAEYMEAFGNGIVPKKAGVAKFKISSKENPAISHEVSVEFRYKNPLEEAKTEQEVYELEEGKKTSFKINTIPSEASEQRFEWSYSKDGIVKVTDSVETETGNVNAPKKTIHYMEALKAGEVTVTGVPYDTTAGCKNVEFTVRVTKDGVVPEEMDYLEMAKNDIEHGTAYLAKQSMEKYGDEWNLFTVLRSGKEVSQETLDKYYKSVEKQVKENADKMRATDFARVIITLEAMGKNPANVDGVNLLEKLYNSKTIASDTSNCPIWALIALDGWKSEIPSDALWTREKLIEQILSFQTEQGGFGLFNNKTSSIDMTGMALQALAPYYKDDTYPEVKKAVDKTLEYLKSQKTDNAGYLDGGKENSCTTAQVLTAVTALQIDPISANAGFTSNENNMVKNLHNYKTEDGFGWQDGKKTNGMAVQQVTYALEAYRRFAEKENSLYDITDVKVQEAEKNGHVVISVERFTIGQGYIYEPVFVPFEDGDNAATLLKKVIGKENFVGKDEYLEAIVGGDLGTDKVVVPEYIEKLSDGDITTETAKEWGNGDNGDGGDALGEFDYSNYSGWMYHVNGEEVGYGITAYEPKDGDVLRFQFTMYGYGTDLTGYEYGNPDPVIDICNKDEITKLMAEVNADRENLMAVPEVKTAYDEAVKLVSAVITPKSEIDAATVKLREAVENAKNGPKGWKWTEEGWQYYENGKKVTGWKSIDGNYYYFNENGIMLSDQWIGDYYVDENGVWLENYRPAQWMITNGKWWYREIDGSYPFSQWKIIADKWYYFDAAGYCVTGWNYINGDWYYLDAAGAMCTGWTSVGGYWYYLNNDGSMETGWISVGGHWYYLNNDGSMETGWISVDGYWYYLNNDGAMAVSQWIGDYYVQADGSMATSQWIEGYYVDASGKWVRNA